MREQDFSVPELDGLLAVEPSRAVSTLIPINGRAVYLALFTVLRVVADADEPIDVLGATPDAAVVELKPIPDCKPNVAPAV